MANLKYNKVSPMKRLIEKFPSLAKVVMDKCITESTNIDTDKNYSIEYDFQYFCPKPGEEQDSEGRRYFGPKVMLENEREELLRHPLCKSLMATKWRSVGVNFFYLGFVVYASFVACLSHYMYCMKQFEMKRKQEGTNRTFSIQGGCSENSIHVSEIALITLSSCNLLYECYPFYSERSKYFDLTNVLQVSTFVCAIIAVYPVNGDTLIFGEAGWNAGVIGVLLSFLTILQYIQCLLKAGIYVTMLFEVLKSLLKVFAMFALLIIGFALVFMFVMDGESQAPFDKYYLSIFKVFAMTIGEIEYSTYFVHSQPGRFQLALVVFLVFSLLMPIALMNLLIGLAVGDIDSVQNHAELKMMSTEVEVVYEFEEKIPLWIRKRMHKSKLIVYPNRQVGLLALKKYLVPNHDSREIQSWRHGGSANQDNSRRDATIKSIEEKVDDNGERIVQLMKCIEEQRAILENLTVALNVNKSPLDTQTSQDEEGLKAILDTETILGRL